MSDEVKALWDEFCETLKNAGEELIAEGVPADETTRVEGLRYLSRMTRAALEWYVEFNDPAFPVLYKPSHETIKIGADNPDNVYLKAVIDGRYDYRITGTRGTVDYLSFATSKGSYAENFTQIETGFLDSKQLSDTGGEIDIVVSSHAQDGQWLPMETESESLLIRQTFLDRAAETAAELHIERLDASAQPEALTLDVATQNFQKASAFFKNTVGLFANWSRQILERPNSLPLWDQAFCQSVGGDPNILYYHGHFRLQPDQAMIITLGHVPDCQTWNIQVDNYWMESLDYRYHRISLNRHSALGNADGSVTLVLSAEDNGHPNWLSTAGHSEGTLCFRWVGCDAPIDPVVEVVQLSQAPTALQS